jgi:hypothetical protein
MKLENKPTVRKGRAVLTDPQPLAPHPAGACRPDRSRIDAIDLLGTVAAR